MSSSRHVTTRLLVVLAAVAGAVFGAVPPASSSVAVALLTTALAALLVLAVRQVCLAGSVEPLTAVATDDPAPLRTGRVTDPIHHPLRPRAPGLV